MSIKSFYWHLECSVSIGLRGGKIGWAQVQISQSEASGFDIEGRELSSNQEATWSTSTRPALEHDTYPEVTVYSHCHVDKEGQQIS